MLRIVFAGSPQLACASLEQLSQSVHCQVVAVLTQADRSTGRGRHLQASPVKARALQLGLETIYTPERLDSGLRAALAALSPDLLVVFAYGKIFGPRFLALFPLGGINLHPSALPEWRGPSPIEAQLRSGSAQLGLSVQRIEREMDAGPILLQECFLLSALAEDYPDYYAAAELVSREGARMLGLVCAGIAQQGVVFLAQAREQDSSRASYCRLLTKADGRIDWQDSAAQIAYCCCAYAAWPKSYTWLALASGAVPVQVNIVAARCWSVGGGQDSKAAGSLLGLHSAGGILVQCGRGILAVSRLQREGRRAVSAKEFANYLQSQSSSYLLPKWQQENTQQENTQQENAGDVAIPVLYRFCDNEVRL